MTPNDRTPSATGSPEGPPAAGGQRELIEDAAESHAAAQSLVALLLGDLERSERYKVELLERVSSAERRVAELTVCGSWHCSGHRRCELARGHDGRHFTTSLGVSYPGWDDSASVDVPQLLEALNAAERRAADRDEMFQRQAAAVRHHTDRADALERRAAESEQQRQYLNDVLSALEQRHRRALEWAWRFRREARAAQAELAYTTSWAHACGGNLTHMDGVAVELRERVAELERRENVAAERMRIAEVHAEDALAMEASANARAAGWSIDLESIARDLAAAREALTFYADENTYRAQRSDVGRVAASPAIQDMGSMARAALADAPTAGAQAARGAEGEECGT